MNETAFYHRQGWNRKEMTVAKRDEKAETCDLADASGAVVVEGVKVIDDHETRETLPVSFAVIAGRKQSSKNKEAPAPSKGTPASGNGAVGGAETGTGSSAPSKGSKTDELIAKAKAGEIEESDLDGISNADLLTVSEALEAEGVNSRSTSKELKAPILAYYNLG
jgi:hypothetical protein